MRLTLGGKNMSGSDSLDRMGWLPMAFFYLALEVEDGGRLRLFKVLWRYRCLPRPHFLVLVLVAWVVGVDRIS